MRQQNNDDLILITHILAAVLGAVIFNKVTNWFRGDREPTELLFFPDKNMPCNSYFERKRCWRKKDCTYLHNCDYDESSLMKIMQTLRDARQVDLCMYRFTLAKVADTFIEMHKKGAKIRIITDNSHESVENNQIPKVKSAGIPVREKSLDPFSDDRSRPLMHNKFVIVDKKCCLLGSFNWTYHAVTKNQETVIKSYEPKIVKQLASKFDEMWGEYG